MDKKTLGIIALLGAVAGGIAVAAAAAAKKEEVPPPPHIYKYSCRFGDGFQTDSWEEMFQHYSTVHPEAKVMDIQIVWV